MNTAQRALRTLNLPKPVATAPISPKNAFMIRAASETPQTPQGNHTFYMFEAQDYTNQKRLGDFTLSKKENALDRGGLLYDATKVMQMTQKFLHKNLTDILRSRKG